MIQIVMRPVKAPVVNHEGLYDADFNGEKLWKVRARNAKHAEEKLMATFRHNLKGKPPVDFDLEAWNERLRKEETDDSEKTEERSDG